MRGSGGNAADEAEEWGCVGGEWKGENSDMWVRFVYVLSHLFLFAQMDESLVGVRQKVAS